MAETLLCWKCGAALNNIILPLSRREECPQCRAELHVCRMCHYFDKHIADQCREERAETVSNKTTANFCDYFQLNHQAYQAEAQQGSRQAKAELAALFGEASANNDAEEKPATADNDKAKQIRQELESLFKESDE